MEFFPLLLPVKHGSNQALLFCAQKVCSLSSERLEGGMEAAIAPSGLAERGCLRPPTFIGMAERIPGPLRARKTGSLLSVAQGSWKLYSSIFSCCIFMNPLSNDHAENS